MPAVRFPPCPGGCYPSHLPGDRDSFLAVQQRYQHKNLIAELVAPAARDKQATAPLEGRAFPVVWPASCCPLRMAGQKP